MSGPEGASATESRMKVAFALALATAALLRLLDLGGSPPGLTATEAALGADARFFALTGSDVAGTSWILPRGAGDFPFPLGRFLALPFVAFVAPSAAVLRLPFALCGLAFVVVLATWVRRRFGDLAAVGTAALAATSPVSVLAARTASEQALMALLAVVAVSSFDRQRPRSLLGACALSLIPFSLNTVGGLFAGAFLPALAWLTHREIRALPDRRGLIASALIVATAFLTAIWLGQTDDGISRRLAISITSYERGMRAAFFMLNAFLTSFHAGWLFVQAGDGGLPTFGVFSLVELPLVLGALLSFVRQPSRELGFLVLWAVAGVVPAAIAFDVYDPSRVVGAAPPVHALAGVGFARLVELARRARPQTAHATLALFGVIELATALAVFSAVSSRRHATNLRFHTEVAEALACAHAYRATSCPDCVITLSPNLPDASTYAAFYEPSEALLRGVRTTIVEERSRASPREIVIAADRARRPIGLQICKQRHTDVPHAVVVVSAARPIVERKPKLETK